MVVRLMERELRTWPYQPSIYAYDALDFQAVKNGQKNPWDLVPYATWPVSALNDQGPVGVTYDAATQKIYLLNNGDGDRPYVRVYHVGADSVSPAPTPTPTPIAGDLNNDGVVNSIDW